MPVGHPIRTWRKSFNGMFLGYIPSTHSDGTRTDKAIDTQFCTFVWTRVWVQQPLKCTRLLLIINEKTKKQHPASQLFLPCNCPQILFSRNCPPQLSKPPNINRTLMSYCSTSFFLSHIWHREHHTKNHCGQRRVITSFWGSLCSENINYNWQTCVRLNSSHIIQQHRSLNE